MHILWDLLWIDLLAESITGVNLKLRPYESCDVIEKKGLRQRQRVLELEWGPGIINEVHAFDTVNVGKDIR